MPDICTDPWGLSDPEDWLHPIPLDWSDRENWASTFWLRYVRRMRAYGVADTRTNARIKLYLYKGVLQVCNDSVFPTGTWEDAKGKKGRQYDVPPKGAAVDPERSAAESRRRAKARVRDIAMCNQFTHFVTWTLDPQKVDRYVWKEAAEQVRRWKEKYGLTVPVSVNVSRVDIYAPDFVENFLNLMQENGLDPKSYYLEITESAYTEDAAQLLDMIRALRSAGFLVEMDDFGSGYSSLNMLSTLPIDILKLDMSFIRNMRSNQEKDIRILELMIDIARYLHVPVVAEGVETEEQMNQLKKLGCDMIQGYYFSKPVPAEEFEQFIREELEHNADN